MKSSIQRRQFIKFMGASSVLAFMPGLVKAVVPPRVVVIGGGFAGASCAKYLKHWGGAAVEVILIEENSNYVSPILSNLVLTGQRSLSQLTFNYETLQNRYAVQSVQGRVAGINAEEQWISLESGSHIPYDKLVMAPGIDFVPVPGHDFDKVPHAWKAGAQTELLASQLAQMPQGGTFVMSIPPSPFRCPPGPYERACVVADLFVQQNRNARIVVLDANPDIVVERNTFGSKFAEYGIVYRPGCRVVEVDSLAPSVTFTNAADQIETLHADVLNVIPPHRAANIIMASGLNAGNWAPVTPMTYASTLAANIYVIGDSQGTGQPKAGHIGNSEAKVCADAILRTLSGFEPDQQPKTNSACYSPVSRNTASWLTAVYEYNPLTDQMQLVPGAGYPAAGAPSRSNFNAMFEWSENLFADTFG